MCPFEPHPVSIDVPDQTIVWKYFERQYFNSLINDHALFFRRVIDFADSDPREGTIPEMDKAFDRKRALMRSSSIEQLKMEVEIAESIDGWGMREGTVINSWKIAETEMDHMWRLYARIGEGATGVAVRSTVGMLKSSFQGQERIIHGSRIRYIDYDRDRFFQAGVYEHGTENVMTPVIHKNVHGYPDENEYRLLHSHTHGGNPKEWWEPFGACRGCKVSVDLSALIAEVVVSPNTSDEARVEVEALSRSQYVFAPVRHSKLVPRV